MVACLHLGGGLHAFDDDEDELEVEERRPEKPKKIKAAAKDKEVDKKKKKPARTCVQIEEIPEDNTAGCDAIHKVRYSAQKMRFLWGFGVCGPI